MRLARIPKAEPSPRCRFAARLLAACLARGALQASACTRNTTVKCGERLDKIVLDTCMEFQAVGMSLDYCNGWQVDASGVCRSSCLDCLAIAGAIQTQCRFSMLNLGAEDGDAVRIDIACAEMATDFMNYRCQNLMEPGGPSYWNDTHDTYECTLPDGIQCMGECGNYQECYCQRWRLDPDNPPDACHGYVLREGVNRHNTSQMYSCDFIPQHCRSDIESTCGAYRWCPSDMCVILDKDCESEIPDQCQEVDLCDPGSGFCYFKEKPLGTPCDDGVFYTLNDTCQYGYCVGFEDDCVRYSVECIPSDFCTTGGTCHPHNGRCTFEHLNDTTPCDDGREWTVEDRCLDGLCVGRAVDLCVEGAVECTVANACYEPGTCDPKTGLCSDPKVVRDVACDDGNPLTLNDTCVDGVCVSGMLEETASQLAFLTLGKGACGDREGRRMASYSGDVDYEKDCEAHCLADLQCAGYSYSHPLCTIYGNLRDQPPLSDRQWAFLAGTDPPAVIIEDAWLTSTGQREGYCRRRGFESDTLTAEAQPDENLSVDDFFSYERLAVYFVCLLAIASWCTFCFTLRKCLFPKPEDREEIKEWVNEQTGHIDSDEDEGVYYSDDEYDQPPVAKISLRDLAASPDLQRLEPGRPEPLPSEAGPAPLEDHPLAPALEDHPLAPAPAFADVPPADRSPPAGELPPDLHRLPSEVPLEDDVEELAMPSAELAHR